jgi:hypothetical protein
MVEWAAFTLSGRGENALIAFLLGSLHLVESLVIIVLILVVLSLNRDLRSHMREEAARHLLLTAWRENHVHSGHA